eukprot:COSAG06_NODE_3427_length_5361_cov_715.776923_9_plen_54_part_00
MEAAEPADIVGTGGAAAFASRGAAEASAAGQQVRTETKGCRGWAATMIYLVGG